MSKNPFPGPQPYRSADRERFFARNEAVTNLANQVLARRATTVFGPSGAGKSSLMQAGVIPALEESEGVRVVRVDAWPAKEKPLAWLASAMFSDFALGDVPQESGAFDLLKKAIALAARRSDGPILIYLDQIEQLFLAEHDESEMNALLQGLAWLIEPDAQRDVHVVLSLREDYLGRLRDFTRERPELSVNVFRVAPLSAKEMVRAMCRTAKEGEPSQTWDEDEIRSLMLDVLVPGQRKVDSAEVQTAFGQIVCRALWEERAAGKTAEVHSANAEAILRRYLDATLEGLGELKENARKLLEEQLIDAEGHRTLLTEKEAQLVLGDKALDVLAQLERAAVLHAEAHQGSRYFELGHDWLAKKVLERRVERQKAEEEKRKHQEEAGRRAKAQRERRTLMTIVVIALVTTTVVAVLGALAWMRTKEARRLQLEATGERDRALRAEQEAHRASQMAAARELLTSGEPSLAVQVLLAVDTPEKARGWRQLAIDVLAQPIPLYTHRFEDVVSMRWSPDGKRLATVQRGKIARVWNADGTGEPVKGPQRIDHVNAWSPDGKRIAFQTEEKTLLVWNADGTGEPVALKGHQDWISSVAWSPDGQRIATGSYDMTVRVWNADGSGEAVVMKGYKENVRSVSWSPDGKRIVTASHGKTVRIWNADGSGKPITFKGHDGFVNAAAWSPDGSRIVTVSDDHTARVWPVGGPDKPIVLEGHSQRVNSAAWSPDGTRIVTASNDKTARVWTLDRTTAIVQEHDDVVWSAAWSPDGRRIVTDALGNTVRVWNASGLGSAMVIMGKGRRLAMWTPSGERILTTSIEEQTARIWNARRDVIDTHDGHVKWWSGWHSDGSHFVTTSMEGRSELETIKIDGPDGRVARPTRTANTFRVWNADGSPTPMVLSDLNTVPLWSPDRKHFVASAFDKTIRVYGLGVGEPVVLKGHEQPIHDVSWSPDGKRLITRAYFDERVWIWNADGSGEPVILSGMGEHLHATCWASDGQHMVTVASDGSTCLYETDHSSSCAPRARIAGIRSAACSPHGNYIALEFAGDVLRIWDFNGSRDPVTIPDKVKVHEWSPDGRRLLTIMSDRTIRIWNADGTGEPNVIPGPAIVAKWSPDGSRIIALANDGKARVWKSDGSGVPVVLQGNTARLGSATWSPDGQRLVLIAFYDDAPSVWNADGSGEPILLTRRGEKIHSATFSPDGQRVLTVSDNGVARVWLLDIPLLTDALRNATTDCLTPSQRETYLLELPPTARARYEECERKYGRTPRDAN